MSRSRSYTTALVWGVTVAIVGLLSLWAMGSGRYGIGFNDVAAAVWAKFSDSPSGLSLTAERVLWGVRWPRVLAALMVGAALAGAGTAFQAALRNPLVSPDILGVSSGASLGAAAAIFFGSGLGVVQLSAFIGGLAAAGAVIAIPRLFKRSSIIYLVLAGIIVNSVANALIGLITYAVTTENTLARIVFWMMGSLTTPSRHDLVQVVGPIAVSAMVLMALAWRLNVVSLGAKQARRLGIDASRTRWVVLVAATVLTASATSIAGTIGWVGLVVPHTARLLLGADNTRTLPYAMVLGGAFLLLVDTVARTLTPAEIPLNIVTGLIGAPFYLWVLVHTRTRLR